MEPNHAKIGIRKTLTQLGDGHNGNELGRSDSNALGYYDQDDVAWDVIQQMVAGCPSTSSLLLRWVHAASTTTQNGAGLCESNNPTKSKTTR